MFLTVCGIEFRLAFRPSDLMLSCFEHSAEQWIVEGMPEYGHNWDMMGFIAPFSYSGIPDNTQKRCNTCNPE